MAGRKGGGKADSAPLYVQAGSAASAILLSLLPMTSTSVTEIVCAHSPDSDDAYMFYGLATKKVRSRVVSFRHVLEDIETLNRKAAEGAY
jgi:riboflavin synthase